MLPITAITASILTFFYVFLALRVISIRKSDKVSLGDGAQPRLQAAIRAHGNFAEYVPLTLGLIALLELDHFAWWILTLAAIALVTARVLHAVSIVSNPQRFALRVLSMQLTFGTLVSLAVLNLSNLIEL